MSAQARRLGRIKGHMDNAKKGIKELEKHRPHTPSEMLLKLTLRDITKAMDEIVEALDINQSM